jgi:hypothetical protein
MRRMGMKGDGEHMVIPGVFAFSLARLVGDRASAKCRYVWFGRVPHPGSNQTKRHDAEALHQIMSPSMAAGAQVRPRTLEPSLAKAGSRSGVPGR